MQLCRRSMMMDTIDGVMMSPSASTALCLYSGLPYALCPMRCASQPRRTTHLAPYTQLFSLILRPPRSNSPLPPAAIHFSFHPDLDRSLCASPRIFPGEPHRSPTCRIPLQRLTRRDSFYSSKGEPGLAVGGEYCPVRIHNTQSTLAAALCS